MRSPKILLVDAFINLILGVLLATFPRGIIMPAWVGKKERCGA